MLKVIKSNLAFFLKTCVFSIVIVSLIITRNAMMAASPDTYLGQIYYPLAVTGQAYMLHLVLLIIFTVISWLPKRLFNGLLVIILTSLNFTLLLDSQLFQLYRFHLDMFFIKMFFIDMDGMGVSYGTVGLGVGVLLAILLLFIALTQYAPRLLSNGKTAAFWSLLFVSTLIGQCIHAWAYAHSMREVVSFSQVIPWYQPLIANDDIQKWGLLNESLRQDNLNISVKSSGTFHYPKSPLQCQESKEDYNIVYIVLESWRFDQLKPEIVPNIYQIGKESLMFTHHLSGGNVTDKGLFSLMYGTSAIYWEDALGAGSEPALVSALKQKDYQFYILANQNIERTKAQDLFFKGITAIQNHQEGSSTEGDQGLGPKLMTAIDNHPNQSFFSFLFFNSTHYRYLTPEGFKKPFLPAEMIEVSEVDNTTDPTPYLNQYFNAGHFIDQLVGQIRSGLEQRNLWDKTIVVITGDHGEEFNESGKNYWGHGSNFSRYQLQVPLVIHWPGKQELIEHRTTHEDISPTLAIEAIGCENTYGDISTGSSLFSRDKRTLIAQSYVNTAIIENRTVNELYPGYIKVYDLNDINEHAKSPEGLLQATQEIKSHFRIQN
ncbi:sulfatase-like hydrolase/transferase [Gynuella sunshinyii]|uniref:Putative hydrolase of alkaline phosphatase superfamily n=1 Tax=Gynuella sunshinyii YC6258 TaxID=1445510 RepID=A0A0C5VQW6_9GAMM|nr:sulfatase-like hydrolase/transferase [Gynuella sunshinyii]AJQ92649.1 putative hydrolase of alkaline phosphatase superfamily [Gynuella sunshinyii YC6258]